MSSVWSVDADDPAAMRYLGVARGANVVPHVDVGSGGPLGEVDGGGAPPLGGAGGRCAACLAAIEICVPIPSSIRRNAGFS
eukprot:1981721-Heterocapsa_arctica.AAC.1